MHSRASLAIGPGPNAISAQDFFSTRAGTKCFPSRIEFFPEVTIQMRFSPGSVFTQAGIFAIQSRVSVLIGQDPNAIRSRIMISPFGHDPNAFSPRI